MKRILYLILLCLAVANFYTIAFMIKSRDSIDFSHVIDVIYEINIYALKCSIIAVILDWYARNWLSKDKTNTKKE